MILRVDPTPSEAPDPVAAPRPLGADRRAPAASSASTPRCPVGGPERLIKTIQQNFGIPINHYVQVNFAGFRSRWSTRSTACRSTSRGRRATPTQRASSVDEPGCVTLDGPSRPSAYARSRHFEIYDENDGEYVARPAAATSAASTASSSSSRLALKRAIAKGVRNPFVLNQLIGVAQRQRHPRRRRSPPRTCSTSAASSRTSTPTRCRSTRRRPPARRRRAAPSVLILDNAGGPADLRHLPGSADTDNPLRAIQRRRAQRHRARPAQAQDVLAASRRPRASPPSGRATRRASATRSTTDPLRARRRGGRGRGGPLPRRHPAVPGGQDAVGRQRRCWSPARTSPQLRTDPRPAADFAVVPGHDHDHHRRPERRRRPPSTTTPAGMVPEPPDGEVCG